MKTLSQHEMRKVERWARATKLDDILTFFEQLPAKFMVNDWLLLGSRYPVEVRLAGLSSRCDVSMEVRNLDQPFIPNLSEVRIMGHQWRHEVINALVPFHRELRKGFAKVCLAQSLGSCSRRIVKAHSLQKAAFKAHAIDGHVYEFDPFSLKRPTLVGINEATTFTGFCDHHDVTIFAPIELEPFTFKPNQLFLYHYRAVAQAYYSRAYAAQVLERAQPDVEKIAGLASTKSTKERLFLNRIDAQEIALHKARYEAWLTKACWNSVRGFAWVGNVFPSLLATDFFAPSKDFRGRPVQDCKSLTPLHWMSLTVSAVEDKALVLLCADENSPILAQMADSLRTLPGDRQTSQVLNFILCQIENFVMLPQWWEPLAASIKQRFIDATYSRFFPRKLPVVCEWGLKEIRRLDLAKPDEVQARPQVVASPETGTGRSG